MKSLQQYIHFFIAGFLIALMPACSKVLEQSPEDRIDLNNYFNTRADAEGALIGAYDNVFRDIVPTVVINDMLSGREIQQIGGIPNRPVQYRPNLRVDNDGGTGTLWANCYSSIARINLLIERVDLIPDGFFIISGVPSTVNRKNEILGEARFLRAWVYFQLVQNWGDVPLILSFPKTANPGDNLVSRAPAADVWTQIQEDLNFAATNLPINHRFFAANQSAAAIRIQSKGRATSGMAKLMLARIALKDRQWQRAADLCSEILSTNEYSLNTNFVTTFSNVPAGGQNAPESILETQSVRDGFVNTGGIFSWEFYTNGRTEVTPQWLQNYEGNYLNPFDVRQLFASNISYNTNNSLRGITQFKYYNRDNAYASADPWNYVLGRLGEVLLIRAEALNELGFPNAEARTLINQIRARAQNSTYTVTVRRQGLPDTTVAAKGIPPVSFDPTTPNSIYIANQQEFRLLIRDERWRELSFEGLRWFDLLRYNEPSGKYSALESVYLNDPAVPGTQVGKILFPIPNAQIRINPRLTQNPGYL